MLNLSYISCLVWPFYNLYIISGKSIGISIAKILESNTSKHNVFDNTSNYSTNIPHKYILKGTKIKVGKLYNYSFIIFLSFTIYLLHKNKYQLFYILFLISVINIIILILANTYKSPNIFIAEI